MLKIARCLFLCPVLIAAVPVSVLGSPAHPTVERYEISAVEDFAKVEAALGHSKAASVEIAIKPGHYEMRDSFRVLRSGVSVRGEGRPVLRLADGVNRPVLVIGTQAMHPQADDAISNVIVSGLVIDGNKEGQTSEYDSEFPWIRNNGIDARTVKGLLIEDVVADNNRSGGVVISWECEDVLVRNSSFERNYFDGIAYYASRRVVTVDCVASNNLSAGISLDNNLVDTMFLRCKLENNGDVGVFARFSERLYFVKCDVVGSGDWAFFFAHDLQGHGIHDSMIVECNVVGNHGAVRMASINEEQSSGNGVLGGLFLENGDRGGDIDSSGSIVLRPDTFDLTTVLRSWDNNDSVDRPAREAAGSPLFLPLATLLRMIEGDGDSANML